METSAAAVTAQVESLWQWFTAPNSPGGSLVTVASLLMLMLVVPIITRMIRRMWIGDLEKVSGANVRAIQRIETLLAFVRSVAYFSLIVMAFFFALRAMFPGFDPATATGALSVVGLILTGMFRELVIDVVKGLDILLNGHYDVGDYVDLGGYRGHVVDFRINYTRLRTPSGEEITVNNSRCIPSRRFPQGTVTNHVNIALKDAADESRARELMRLIGLELKQQIEFVQDQPVFEESFPLPASGGLVLRYALQVVPGSSWVLSEALLPLIRRSFDTAGVPLVADPTYFHMNDIAAFRRLFRRNGSALDQGLYHLPSRLTTSKSK